MFDYDCGNGFSVYINIFLNFLVHHFTYLVSLSKVDIDSYLLSVLKAFSSDERNLFSEFEISFLLFSIARIFLLWVCCFLQTLNFIGWPGQDLNIADERWPHVFQPWI